MITQKGSGSAGHLYPAGATTDCPTGGWTYGTWHHLCVCLDRTTSANSGIYLDGQAWGGGLSQTAFSSMSGAINFCGVGYDYGGTYVGGLAFCALYTTCLTQAQVQAHVAASVCPPTRKRPNIVTVVQ